MQKARNAVLLILVVLCLPLILAWVAIYLVCMFVWGILLRAWFWRAHASQGRFILFVYSESPNWQTYVEAKILPRLTGKAVVLNWSQRTQWSSHHPWEERFYRRFAGDREFNPIALVFGPRGRITAIRFHQAFLDYKLGNQARLEQAEARLFELARAAA